MTFGRIAVAPKMQTALTLTHAPLTSPHSTPNNGLRTPTRVETVRCVSL